MVKTFAKQLGQILIILLAFVIPISTTLTDIVFYCAVFCGIIASNWLNKESPLANNRVTWCLLALFLLLAIGMLYSTAPWSARLAMLGKYDKLLGAVFLLPLFKNTSKKAISAFSLAMTITLFASYAIYWHWLPIHSPNTIGGAVFKNYLEQNLLMAFACYLFAREAIQQKKLRWLLIILLLLAVYNTLFISIGRSGYVVLAVLTLLFAWQQFRWRGLLVSVIALPFLIIAVFHFSSAFKQRLDEVNSNITALQHGQTETSVGERLTFYHVSFALVKAHPLFGTGTGSFTQEYKQHAGNAVISAHNPHNEYLNLAVQLGAPGVLLLLLLFFTSWKDSYLLPEQAKCIAQAITLTIAIGSCANSWLMDFTPGHLYVYFLILAFSALPARKY